MRRKDAEERGEGHEQDTPGRANAHAPRAPRAPPPPSSSSRSQKQVPVTEPKKQAPAAKKHTSSRPSRKPAKADRNALSARSTADNLLSKAAIDAQARADAVKEQPAKKRQRRMPAQPAHEPSSPSPPCANGSSRALDDVTDEETRDLVAVAGRNSFLTPVTSEEAATFLRAIMGLELFVDDGEIVGCNLLNGTMYSTDGASGEPLPPGARAAFMLAYGDKLKDEDAHLGWQTVPPPKGQRRSRDQRAHS